MADQELISRLEAAENRLARLEQYLPVSKNGKVGKRKSGESRVNHYMKRIRSQYTKPKSKA
jgi:hypothetical protein